MLHLFSLFISSFFSHINYSCSVRSRKIIWSGRGYLLNSKVLDVKERRGVEEQRSRGAEEQSRGVEEQRSRGGSKV